MWNWSLLRHRSTQHLGHSKDIFPVRLNESTSFHYLIEYVRPVWLRLEKDNGFYGNTTVRVLMNDSAKRELSQRSTQSLQSYMYVDGCFARQHNGDIFE